MMTVPVMAAAAAAATVPALKTLEHGAMVKMNCSSISSFSQPQTSKLRSTPICACQKTAVGKNLLP
eukprot:SAG11_NODE_674_length_7801_cov_3.578032_4_plen_66_part_00